MRPGRKNRLPNHVVGLIAAVAVSIALLLSFTRDLPWGSAYEVRAVFPTAQNITLDAPVRIAGVNVGKVTGVDRIGTEDGEAAVVTMAIEDEGRPLAKDATFKLRPRLFLEGNLFVDVQPGTPGAAEVPDGYTYPTDRATVSVQLDQVLTTLQSDVRKSLQVALADLGAALTEHGGASGLQELFRTSPPAYRYTAQVNEAALGTEPHDLSGVIENFDRVARALARDRVQLQGLVSNLEAFTGAFAAEDEALERAIAELPGVLEAGGPALSELSGAFPSLRAFAREALPGVRAADPALDQAVPFAHQLRLLSARRELGRLLDRLRPAVPALAVLSRRTVDLLGEARPLSSCFNEVVVPWAHDRIEIVDPLDLYPHDEPEAGEPPDPVYKQTAYGLVGVAGESRSGDGNAQYARVESGGGQNTVAFPPGPGRPEEMVGVIPFEIIGSVPNISDSAKTPFRPKQPCETQERPDLRSSLGPAPAQSQSSTADPAAVPGLIGESARRVGRTFDRIARVGRLYAAGRNRAAEALRREVIASYEGFLDSRFPSLARQLRTLGGRR